MGTCNNPDVYSWIQTLPPISQWRTSTLSTCICSSTNSQTSLNFSIAKNHKSTTTITFSIVIEYNVHVSLWTSKPFATNSTTTSNKLLDEKTISTLIVNFIEDILCYGSYNNNRSHIKIPNPNIFVNFKEVFNMVFFTLCFLVCIYEAPLDLRSTCLSTLKNVLANCQVRNASKLLMKHLGSNLEEQWMRSINLAITNWILELQASQHVIKTPSPLFSYSLSTFGMWKTHLYCPIIAMDLVSSSHPNDDERLSFSLNCHQLEGVIQFNHKVAIQKHSIDMYMNTDNIRCDVIKLISNNLLNERGVGATEKHFPSRISLQITPMNQSNILSVSVSKSTDNPLREIELEKAIEAGFDPPNSYLGLKVSAAETTTMSLKPWKFEESIHGYSAKFNWFLHDSVDGREVFSSKPSTLSLLHPKAWFKDRYSNAHRPFTRQGGVIFARDEYGECVKWTLDKSALGKTMEWEVRGWIWVTYWPNKYKTFYSETKRCEFREIFQFDIA